MKINPLRSYALGIAAALIAIPGFAPMHAAAQSTQLFSANAVLTHSLNSNNVKAGQSVTAKLTSDATSQLPKGTMLIGKVDQVQNASTDGASKMSITFNQARLSNGQEIPIKAMLLGAYPPVVYNHLSGTSTYLPTQPNTVSDAKGVSQQPGALNGIGMESSGRSDASAVFTSTNRNIKLENGTVLQVAIAPMAGSGVAAPSGTAGDLQ